MEKRGYIVLSSPIKHEIPSTIPGAKGGICGPLAVALRIIKETDREDDLKQYPILGVKAPSVRSRYYYRCVAE